MTNRGDQVNPSTAQAKVLVDELIRNGLRHVVLAPGSRNAPLSFAFHSAAEQGRLTLHVRIDERSAGFLALGLAANTRRPVAVACTSGTATANLHPSVSEAYHGGVPLLVLTADRPPELRAAGANQTIDQQHVFGETVFFDELAVAENRNGQNAYWRTQMCRAWHAAEGQARGGPVQLNIPFREPLVPTDGGSWCESLTGRTGGRPWTEVSQHGWAPSTLQHVESRRGLVLVADDSLAEGACAWAERYGWPALSELGGAGLSGSAAIHTGMWLLNLPDHMRLHLPEQVVCVGRPTVFRQVGKLLTSMGVEVLLTHGSGTEWPAPGFDVREVAESFGEPPGPADPGWLTSWQQANHKAYAALHAALDLERWPSGLAIARDVVDTMPAGALLMLGSSNPARDVALAARNRPDIMVRRNRGVAGIDGTVSTAIGAALAQGRQTYAVLGDLTFLHDSNGLLLGPDEQRPDLTIVVVNDDGGGIFSLLEQGDPAYAGSFERVFGTPHGTDLSALCSAHGVEYVRVDQRRDLVAALREQGGLRVVEVATDRADLRAVHSRLQSAVRTAVLG